MPILTFLSKRVFGASLVFIRNFIVLMGNYKLLATLTHRKNPSLYPITSLYSPETPLLNCAVETHIKIGCWNLEDRTSRLHQISKLLNCPVTTFIHFNAITWVICWYYLSFILERKLTLKLNEIMPFFTHSQLWPCSDSEFRKNRI